MFLLRACLHLTVLLQKFGMSALQWSHYTALLSPANMPDAYEIHLFSLKVKEGTVHDVRRYMYINEKNKSPFLRSEDERVEVNLFSPK